MPPKSNNIILQTIDALFKVILGYIKGQSIFFILNFVLISLFLGIFGVPLPLLIALGICLLDLLPVIGSGLIFVPWIIISYLNSNSELGFKLILLYLGLIILRQILEPLIVGKNIGLSPLWTLLASLAGLLLFGAPGFIICPIIAAVCNTVYRLRQKNSQTEQKT